MAKRRLLKNKPKKDIRELLKQVLLEDRGLENFAKPVFLILIIFAFVYSLFSFILSPKQSFTMLVDGLTQIILRIGTLVLAYLTAVRWVQKKVNEIQDEEEKRKKHRLIFKNVGDKSTVAGRIIDTKGNPEKEVKVNLVLRNRPDNPRSVWTDHEGQYEFRNVQPGCYLLAASIALASTPDTPFRKIYYPGVIGADQAEIIYIDEESEPKTYDIISP